MPLEELAIDFYLYGISTDEIESIGCILNICRRNRLLLENGRHHEVELFLGHRRDIEWVGALEHGIM